MTTADINNDSSLMEEINIIVKGNEDLSTLISDVIRQHCVKPNDEDDASAPVNQVQSEFKSSFGATFDELTVDPEGSIENITSKLKQVNVSDIELSPNRNDKEHFLPSNPYEGSADDEGSATSDSSEASNWLIVESDEESKYPSTSDDEGRSYTEESTGSECEESLDSSRVRVLPARSSTESSSTSSSEESIDSRSTGDKEPLEIAEKDFTGASRIRFSHVRSPIECSSTRSEESSELDKPGDVKSPKVNIEDSLDSSRAPIFLARNLRSTSESSSTSSSENSSDSDRPCDENSPKVNLEDSLDSSRVPDFPARNRSTSESSSTSSSENSIDSDQPYDKKSPKVNLAGSLDSSRVPDFPARNCSTSESSPTSSSEDSSDSDRPCNKKSPKVLVFSFRHPDIPDGHLISTSESSSTSEDSSNVDPTSDTDSLDSSKVRLPRVCYKRSTSESSTTSSEKSSDLDHTSDEESLKIKNEATLESSRPRFLLARSSSESSSTSSDKLSDIDPTGEKESPRVIKEAVSSSEDSYSSTSEDSSEEDGSLADGERIVDDESEESRELDSSSKCTDISHVESSSDSDENDYDENCGSDSATSGSSLDFTEPCRHDPKSREFVSESSSGTETADEVWDDSDSERIYSDIGTPLCMKTGKDKIIIFERNKIDLNGLAKGSCSNEPREAINSINEISLKPYDKEMFSFGSAKTSDSQSEDAGSSGCDFSLTGLNVSGNNLPSSSSSNDDFESGSGNSPSYRKYPSMSDELSPIVHSPWSSMKSQSHHSSNTYRKY